MCVGPEVTGGEEQLSGSRGYWERGGGQVQERIPILWYLNLP